MRGPATLFLLLSALPVGAQQPPVKFSPAEWSVHSVVLATTTTYCRVKYGINGSFDPSPPVDQCLERAKGVLGTEYDPIAVAAEITKRCPDEATLPQCMTPILSAITRRLVAQYQRQKL